MNTQELKTFIENYKTVSLNQETAKDYFNKCLDKLSQRIIVECDELVKPNDDELNNILPCPYRTFDIKKWHIKQYSGFVFFNLLLNKVGILLTGYQGKNEIKKFETLWDEKYKKAYKQNSNLIALTWLDKDEDDYAINNGYFKPIDGTSGKLFNPLQISEIGDYFYWGQLYPLDIENLDDKFYDTIATDFKNILTTFLITSKVK